MSRSAKILILEVLAAALAAALVLALLPTAPADAAPNLPSRFQEKVVIGGLNFPTAVEFSKNGKVFVAEKGGLIKVFDDLSDRRPTTFADLRAKVHNWSDRGLLGLALHPKFPRKPFVYVLYTQDAPIGGATPPRYNDACEPNCVASGHLSRLKASAGGNRMTGSEKVLIEDWCITSSTHSVGNLAFGKDGALYVSGGEGAYFKDGADYGQQGDPPNACGDPPREGGALRAQDLRTPGDRVTLDGAILRVNPETGKALPTNPLYSRDNPNAKRIVAYGLRNPFRFAIRPGTNELRMGDDDRNA